MRQTKRLTNQPQKEKAMSISYVLKTNPVQFCISVADIALNTDWNHLLVRKFDESLTVEQKELIIKIEDLEVKLSDEILRSPSKPTLLKNAQTLDIAEEIAETIALLLAEKTLGIFDDGVGPVDIAETTWEAVEKANPGLMAIVYKE
jgi:hypothetical protein